MSNNKQIEKPLELPHQETIVGTNTIQTKPFDNQKTMSNDEQQTAVDSILEFCHKQMDNDYSIHKGVYLSIIKFCQEQTPFELPSDEEMWRWWQTQKFQKEQGEQEYTMLYEIDLPKILKSFTEHLIKGGNK